MLPVFVFSDPNSRVAYEYFLKYSSLVLFYI